MSKKDFKLVDGDHVPDDMLEGASQVFSENYGFWDEHAAHDVGKGAKPGSRVRLSKRKLRKDFLLKGISSCINVWVDDNPAGHALACRWRVDGRIVCWITQLVIHRDYRERGLATRLLAEIKEPGDEVYGIMSCHPAACLASARAFAGSMDNVSLSFIREHAEPVIRASPVPYIRNAKLRGKLFHSHNTRGLVSSVDTSFHVDHEEPLRALARLRGSWPLGKLADGHEFLLIVQARRRFRSAHKT